MSRQKAFEESFAMDGSRGLLQKHRTEGGKVWWAGSVFTPWGVVAIYGDEHFTRYDFAHRGRHWMRGERRARTDRGIAIEATKFARRISRER